MRKTIIFAMLVAVSTTASAAQGRLGNETPCVSRSTTSSLKRLPSEGALIACYDKNYKCEYALSEYAKAMTEKNQTFLDGVAKCRDAACAACKDEVEAVLNERQNTKADGQNPRIMVGRTRVGVVKK